MPFLDSLDIGNAAAQLCGADQISSPTEVSKTNREISFAYDKERRAELRRNSWTFAIKKAALRPLGTTTMLLQPATYSASVTYSPGAIVKDANSLYWISQRYENINNSPGGNNDAWDMYFGPLSVSQYDSDLGYFAGELVYKTDTAFAGGYNIYMSLISQNTSAPDVPTDWDAAASYPRGTVVTYSGRQYRSTAEINVGITPFDGALFLPWDATATYSASQMVTGSNLLLYLSVGSGNIGHDPVTDGGVHWTPGTYVNAWVLLPLATPATNVNWMLIDARMTNLVVHYPLGSGPVSQQGTRNVYRLPAGFLRSAAQDPKAGSRSWLGAPSGLAPSQWNFEGDYIVSGGYDNSPIIFRFVADVTRVTAMDDMFCVGLACNIATAVCESLTQSTAKLQLIASMYKLKITEARLVNAIEAGPVEPPEDDYVTCRI